MTDNDRMDDIDISTHSERSVHMSQHQALPRADGRGAQRHHTERADGRRRIRRARVTLSAQVMLVATGRMLHSCMSMCPLHPTIVCRPFLVIHPAAANGRGLPANGQRSAEALVSLTSRATEQRSRRRLTRTKQHPCGWEWTTPPQQQWLSASSGTHVLQLSCVHGQVICICVAQCGWGKRARKARRRPLRFWALARCSAAPPPFAVARSARTHTDEQRRAATTTNTQASTRTTCCIRIEREERSDRCTSAVVSASSAPSSPQSRSDEPIATHATHPTPNVKSCSRVDRRQGDCRRMGRAQRSRHPHPSPPP